MSETTVTWTSGKQLVAESGSGHAMVLDAGAAVGGRNTGPTPMELLLMGLAGCTAIDVIFILVDKRKKELTALEVKVVGQRAEDPPKVYTEIEVTYKLRGRNLPLKDALRALRLSAENYCSVSAMLEKTATIHHLYELHDEATGETFKGTLAEE